jgi:hypothetical protein
MDHNPGPPVRKADTPAREGPAEAWRAAWRNSVVTIAPIQDASQTNGRGPDGGGGSGTAS